MLTFDRHCYLSFPSIFLAFLLVLLQSDTICQIFHSFSDNSQLLASLLDGEAVGWVGLQTTFEKIDKRLRVVFGHAGDIKGNPINFKFSFVLAVVEFRFIKGDKLEYNHGDREEIRFELIEFELVLHIVEVLKLLG